MIRRPPTIIALDENEVESHIQRIYIRHTLTVKFEQLHLESCDEMDSSPSSCVSSESDVDIDTTGLSQEGSSCFEPTPRNRNYASRDAIPHTSLTKSCLKSPTTNQQTSLQVTISTGVHSQADRSVDPPRLKVKFALSPQDLELHSDKAPPEESASTPQVSFLSCGVSSSPATASVPLRDLTLASTVSYEEVLAERVDSPASVANNIGEDCDFHTKIVV
ncbi:uncharacterized protein N7500_005406 [Penicillium coprophilum]|uniref:uncharacterized protein n=1 Tax=Penicillium coprophilum TaxID=36646 RepID=UPI00239F2112|nr:uncharacterized protein N7500_005406 [Penicillium coprophilum]KAJ5163576.1 hypothetical protein N7500_005406 [Penicillium coprophilum]